MVSAQEERQTATPIVGREEELAVLDRFLADSTQPFALLVEGEPGIGKTTLWARAVAGARERS